MSLCGAVAVSDEPLGELAAGLAPIAAAGDLPEEAKEEEANDDNSSGGETLVWGEALDKDRLEIEPRDRDLEKMARPRAARRVWWAQVASLYKCLARGERALAKRRQRRERRAVRQGKKGSA